MPPPFVIVEHHCLAACQRAEIPFFTASVTLIINHHFPESIKGMRELIEAQEGTERLIQA
jgi:hypothetical protein